MPSLSSIHNPASGLRIAQANIAVTGHNISNVNTDGFSRQRINQGDFPSRNIGVGLNLKQVGMGADILSIQQVRNKFMDMMFRSEVGRAHFYDTQHTVSSAVEETMRELQNMELDEIRNSGSGMAVTRQIWMAVQELSMNPSGIEARGNFISASVQYINRMNDTHRRLVEQQNVLNGEVKDLVSEINRLLNTINDMNAVIMANEQTGQNANDFRDTRNLAQDRLSAILDVDFRHNQRTGQVEVTSNGHQLVSGGIVTYVGLRFTAEGSNLVEPVVGQDVVPGARIFDFDPNFRYAHSLLRLDRPPRDFERPGQLMGVIMSRGLFQADHTSTAQEVDPAWNLDPANAQDARAIAQWEARNHFNAHHTTIPRTIRELDIKFNHAVTLINEYFMNQNPGTRGEWSAFEVDANGRPLVIFDPVEGYVLAQTNAAGVLEPIIPFRHPTINIDREDVPGGNHFGVPIFILRDPDHIDAGRITADAQYDAAAFPQGLNMNGLNFTLGNVVINPLLLTPTGYNYLGLSTNLIDRDDNQTMIAMLGTWHENLLTIENYRGERSAAMGMDDFYNHIVTNLAAQTSRIRNLAETQLDIVQEIEGTRHRTFGVSLDEEMTNMMRFQHSFNAASRAINTINDMLETLLTRTGRVGL